MKRKYIPVIKEDSGLWIGWIEEIPGVKCQAQTRSELIKNLFSALVEAEGLNHEDKVKTSEAWRLGEIR